MAMLPKQVKKTQHGPERLGSGKNTADRPGPTPDKSGTAAEGEGGPDGASQEAVSPPPF